jgi:hypothetical protein
VGRWLVSQTHDLAEWASVLSLGIAVHAGFSVPYFLLVDASRRDFDPRPALRRVLAAVHQDAVHAGYDLAWAAASARHELVPYSVPLRHAVYGGRELARDVAALLLLLTTSPKGQLR